jgi:hypothetical protein
MKAPRLVVDDDGEPAMMDELTMRKTDEMQGMLCFIARK